MSELYRHLLIPPEAEFAPTLENLHAFFAELESAGALPDDPKFVVVRATGRVIFGRNPVTGKLIPIPRLKVDRFEAIEPALSLIVPSSNYDLIVRGFGPTSTPPFEVYSADNYATSVLGEKQVTKHEYSVHCHFRDEVEQVHWSAFDDPDESSGQLAIRSPWAEKPIVPSGLSHSRFTVEFGIGDYLMPRIADTVEILNPRLVAIANQAFATAFAQGCRINDD